MAEYVKKRMAVISRDAGKTLFLELEGSFCDCEVSVLREPPEDISCFDLVIADAESGMCVSEDPRCTVICLLPEKNSLLPVFGDCVWYWPVSIYEIHKAIAELHRKDGVSCERETASVEQFIYLLSEEEHTVLYRNRQIVLSESLWRLLGVLGERSGELVSRDELRSLFGGEGNLVEVYIHGLRKKLELPFGIRLIETVRGKGYRLLIGVKNGL